MPRCASATRSSPTLGPGVANIFMDAVMASGATAHLAFCPNAGVVVERAKVHAGGHSLFLQVPMWDAFDSPGAPAAPRAGRAASPTCAAMR